jgi:hypothetical protein
MANPQIMFSNVANYTITGSQACSGSNTWSNLNDFDIATVWQSSVGDTDQTLTVDMGSNTAVTTIVVDNHNWYVALMPDATLEISGSTVSNFSSLAYNATHAAGTYGSSTRWFITLNGNGATARYWRFTFKALPSWGSNPAPYAGNIMLGSRFEFDQPYDWGYKVGDTEYKTSETIALDGTICTSQTYKGRIIYEVKFSQQTDTTVATFQTLVRSLRGKMYPFYFIDVDGTTVYYMHMEDYVPATNKLYNQNEIALKLRTAVSSY